MDIPAVMVGEWWDGMMDSGHGGHPWMLVDTSAIMYVHMTNKARKVRARGKVDGS